MLTDEKRTERRRLAAIAAEQAKMVLRRGDQLRVTKCPGTKRWITFECWSGQWIVSKSGIDDYHPIHVDRLNGKPVDFTKDMTGAISHADHPAVVKQNHLPIQHPTKEEHTK